MQSYIFDLFEGFNQFKSFQEMSSFLVKYDVKLGSLESTSIA